ncbi:DUF6343 family protein [Streptomyces sp. NPDC047117]|uniref:DUF6343 family protein n=1 Tax=Streptomyces sp. NPDC047117 TaxID=3155379 RepID=UPI0033CBB692
MLKTRRALALWGLVWAAAGVAAFLIAGRPGWAAACAMVAALAATDLVIVCRHIRQGPHYQPGKDIPPYEPDRGRNTGYVPGGGDHTRGGHGGRGDGDGSSNGDGDGNQNSDAGGR